MTTDYTFKANCKRTKKVMISIVLHVKRHPEEISHHLPTWEPTRGKRNIGKPAQDICKAARDRYRTGERRDVYSNVG